MKRKICTKCNIAKDILSFPLNKSGKDSINPSCKECKCKESEKEVHYKTKKLRRLAVDHDRLTGKVRGLLCSSCNTGIGKFKDNIQIMYNAIEYIKRNK